MKAVLIGAVLAMAAGLTAGAAVREPFGLVGGQQQVIARAAERMPDAFDSWYPTEGAPPAPYVEAEWSAPADDGRYAYADLTPVSDETYAAAAIPEAESDFEPEPYLPSERGDILASYDMARPQLPPPEPPSWMLVDAPSAEVYAAN